MSYFGICGIGLVVEHVLAKDETGVRFSYPAQNKKSSVFNLSVYLNRKLFKIKEYVDKYVYLGYKRHNFLKGNMSGTQRNLRFRLCKIRLFYERHIKTDFLCLINSKTFHVTHI